MTEEENGEILNELRETHRQLRELISRIQAELTETRAELTQRIARVEAKASSVQRAGRDDLRRLGVLVEAQSSRTDLVAEGMISTRKQVDSLQQELAAELSGLKSMIRVLYAGLDRRLNVLERRSTR